MDNLYRINVKIFTPTPAGTNLEPFLSILTKWKDQETHWLDIADYLHMVDGPGVVLYGKKCFVSFDNTDGLAGVQYANRAPLEGDLKQRIQTVLEESLKAAKAIVNDALCPKAVSTLADTLDITFNDRKNAPPTLETEKIIEPIMREVLSQQFGEETYQIEKITDTKRSFGYQVNLKQPLTLQ